MEADTQVVTQLLLNIPLSVRIDFQTADCGMTEAKYDKSGGED